MEYLQSRMCWWYLIPKSCPSMRYRSRRSTQRPADALVITDSGQPGPNATVQTDPLLFVEAVSDDDHVKVSVVTWMKSKMSNVIHKDVATITQGRNGVLAVPHVVAVIKNVQSLIATVWLFRLIVNDVPMLLSSLNGPNGMLAVLNVVMVS